MDRPYVSFSLIILYSDYNCDSASLKDQSNKGRGQFVLLTNNKSCDLIFTQYTTMATRIWINKPAAKYQ